MSIEAISAAAGLSAAAAPLSAQAVPATGSGFATLVDQIEALNQRMQSNESTVQTLALGGTGNLHQVMMNMETARLQFDLLLQVRNKVMDAYQQLMSMQV